MEDANAMSANNVARAIATALDWNSTPDARKAAVSFLESIKAGDIRILANTSFLLVKRDWSSEIRLHAFKMLQHLVRLRWEELDPSERKNFANISVDLMSEIADPCEEWPLKSQKAALVAEIIRREGLNLWQDLLPSLIALSGKGPIQAELVSMVLRWLPEDITVHNEDLEGDRRRLLLRGLTLSLPEILPLFYTLLERHFGAALSEASRQQMDIAKQHAATVTATLNAVNAYAEWAPLPDLAKYGIINCCGFLLSAPDFRLHACEFFKLVSPRKRPVDASASEFDYAMSSIFQMLMNISREFLYRSGSSPGAIDEGDYEFAEYICESMVSLGSSNLQSIAGDSTILLLYLEQMLGYFRHFKFAIHFHSLQFWLVLMRDIMSKPKIATHSSADSSATGGSGSREGENAKKKTLNLVNDDFCAAILDTSFPRMLKREKLLPGTALSLGALELWSDDFEGKGEFSQYRSRLLELIRFVASFKPLLAASKVSEKIDAIIKNLLHSPAPAQDLAVMDSMQLALENVVNAVFDGSNEFSKANAEVQLALCRIFEGLLQQLLSLKWTEPALVEVLGHYLDAMGPFLKYFPDAVGSVINKLFELLTSLPFIIKDTSTFSARHARLQICTSFIRIAKAADKSVLPHMKGIADTMACLQKEGSLLRGEHNLLGEAFLVMASAAGIQQQQEVLAWLLEPLSQQWTQLEWQDKYLSDPQGLIRLCSEAPIMWSIFHTVTFFEKALKRSGLKKAYGNSENSSTPNSTTSNPMASHVLWMLPPLLKLLRAIHSLWSPSIYQTLPGEVKAAMSMSDVERFSLLGEGNVKVSKGALTMTDGSQEGYTESNEVDIRNWHIRQLEKLLRDLTPLWLVSSYYLFTSIIKEDEPSTLAMSILKVLTLKHFSNLYFFINELILSGLYFFLQRVSGCGKPLQLHATGNRAGVRYLMSFLSALLQRLVVRTPTKVINLEESRMELQLVEDILLAKLWGSNRSIQITSILKNTNSLADSFELDITSIRVRGLIGNFEEGRGYTVIFQHFLELLMKYGASCLPCHPLHLFSFPLLRYEYISVIIYVKGSMSELCIMETAAELRRRVGVLAFKMMNASFGLKDPSLTHHSHVSACQIFYISIFIKRKTPKSQLFSVCHISLSHPLSFGENSGGVCAPKNIKLYLHKYLGIKQGNYGKGSSRFHNVHLILNQRLRSI
ncbi:protein HASTY 1 [Senna tora]|uniref:Protein HASTY 1 n=1 Tax=Senna tora TaxID=362788 RepID=A0A834SX46_9FABA|nr:protein HASTY 1 [Senna tora]